MAYGLKYEIPWCSKTTDGIVNIYKNDYAGPADQLLIEDVGIRINTTFGDWHEPIIKQNAQLSIRNDKNDFFELLPLLTGEDKEYKVEILKITPDQEKLFEGYVNTEVIEQTYLKKQTIDLVASNYLSKLEDKTPECIETLERQPIINTLINTLKMIEDDSSVFTNITMYPYGTLKTSTNNALNMALHENEVFWKNNIERDNGEDILIKLLKPFDSYIYRYDGNWFIERYDDINNQPQKYIMFDTAHTYSPSTGGVEITRNDASTDIWSVPHLNNDQSLRITPGLNTIEVELNEKPYISLSYNQWDNIEYDSDVNAIPQPYGSWLFHYDTHAVQPTSYYENYNTYKTILKTFRRKNIPYTSPNIGARTSFQMQIPPIQDGASTLKISWKWSPGLISSDPAYQPGNTDFLARYMVEIRRFNDDIYNSGLPANITFDKTTSHWFIPDPYSSAWTAGITEKEIKKEDMNAPYVIENSISIPINDISTNILNNKEGDYVMLFRILPTRFWHTVGGWTTVNEEFIGDVVIKIDSPGLKANLISGVINENFISKQKISLDLFESPTFNLRNGLWMDYNGRESLIKEWRDAKQPILTATIPEKIIKSKFKLFQRARQTISSTIYTNKYLKPFSLWYDSKQNNKLFVLTSYTYIPQKETYQCVWNEFDNDSEVNLNK